MFIEALKLKTLSRALGFAGLALMAASCTMFTDSDEFVLEDDGSPETTCEKMCDLVMDNCGNGFAQYDDDWDACFSFCETLAKGTPGDQEGNTQECRLYHAGLTATGAETHCAHAGESGAGVCVGAPPVDDCGPLCSDLAEACTDAFDAAFQGADVPAQVSACIASCKKLPKSGKAAENFGNTLQCRQTYLRRGQIDEFNATLFCESAQPLADGVYICTDGEEARCDALCLNYMALCDGQGPWASADECNNECAMLSRNNPLLDFNCMIEKMRSGQCDATGVVLGTCSTIGIP